MNLVQRVKGDQATFGDVASTILLMALREGSQSNPIDVVFDTYQENSIENSERSVRGMRLGTSCRVFRAHRSCNSGGLSCQELPIKPA